MLTDLVQDRKFKWIMWSQFFLALGFLASPTIVALYHIIIIIPALIIFFQDKQFKIPVSGWFLLALTAWGIFTTSYNFQSLYNPNKSFQELKFYLLGVILIPALKYFYERATDFQVKRLVTVVYFVVVVAFFVGISKAFLGFDPVKLQFGDFGNRSGGFTNYMRYGYASAFLFLLSTGFYLNYGKLKKLLPQKLFFLGSLLSILAIFAAKTRGALLALMVGIPILFLKYQPKLAKIVIALGTAFVALVLFISFTSNSKIRFLDIKDGSNKKRVSQFYTAVKSIEERPIWGLGADQFSYHVPALKQKYDIWSKDYQGHSHNILLEHAVNYGLPGLLLFVGFLLSWFFDMYSRRDDFGWVILSYITAFVISGQVELLFDNTNSHLIFYIYSLSYALPKTRFLRLHG